MALCVHSDRQPRAEGRSAYRGGAYLDLVLDGAGGGEQEDVHRADVGAAVVMPPRLVSRRGCHFRHDCYSDYQPALPLWDILHRKATTRALAAAGVCVAPNDAAAQERREGRRRAHASGHAQQVAHEGTPLTH